MTRLLCRVTGLPLRDGRVPDIANRKNMALLVQLRWIAVIGQVLTIAVVQTWFGIALPLRQMGLVLLLLAELNVLTTIWLHDRPAVTQGALLAALILDVLALSAQLWLSGGVTNPFLSLYLLQIALAAVLLDTVSTWVIVIIAFASILCLKVSYRPLVPVGPDRGDIFSLHTSGILLCLALDAVLLVAFVTRMTRNLRERDAHLAALRQHAAEENHIVRMGLLATGAAHELGTPLASLSVILGDWQRLPAIAGDPEALQELKEMQAAVARCKSIVSGILLSAGEARGEASAATTLGSFMNDIVREWRERRASDALSLRNGLAHDLPIVSDAVVKQAIFNLLDNALEASARQIWLEADRDGETLVLRVRDAGPGFAPAALKQIGKPYQSSKGRPGRGLGLFLVVSVVRKLGGSVSARNAREGGAEVTITLPLAALSIPEAAHA